MYQRYIKRTLDIILSSVALIILSPLLLLLSILIFLDDGLPIIYKQKRLGRNGKSFYIFKFRTMVKNADQVGPLYTLPQDSRVTRIGFRLRDFSLDELPQLFNIFRGDMSIIGPRPDIDRGCQALDPSYQQKLKLRPGLLCLVDIYGRSLNHTEQKLQYDLEYVKRCSFCLDLKIIAKGFLVVIKREGVNSSIQKKPEEKGGE